MKNKFSLTFAKDLSDNFNNDANDQYFLLLGKVDTWVNAPYLKIDDDTPAANIDTLEKSNYAWRDGIGLKRISSRNIYHMIERNNWTYGAVYDAYDHTVNLFDTSTPKTFFTYTLSGNVYKCISNNGGVVSQYEPDHNTTPIITYNDGYKWKFMYKVTENSRDFITSTYIPVQLAKDNTDSIKNQWNAQQDASNGSVDIVNTTLVGSGWTAGRWTKSSPIGGATDKLVGANAAIGDTKIKIDATDHDVTTDYYKGYAIYISSGDGVGQKRLITGYIPGDEEVSFTSPLIESLSVVSSSYKILPNVIINGDGASADAIPVLTDGDYTINEISMLNSGVDYTIADIKIYPREVEGGNIDDVAGLGDLRGPTFSAIIPPPGGHSINALNEFNSSKIMILANIKGDDGNFKVLQDFRQIAIIKNPTISGGTNDGEILGTEISRRKQMTVNKPYFGTAFNDQAFTVGNSIMGETTKATGKIENWDSDPSEPDTGTLELSNVQGDFDFDDPASISTRIVFNSDSTGNTGDLIVGNILKQTNSALTAVGKIKSWSAPSGGPYEVIVDVTSNTFTSGSNAFESYEPDGTITTPLVNWSVPQVVERKMGELVKHYSSEQGVDFGFIDFNSNQNVARINKLTDVQDEETLESSYAITTKLIIQSSSNNLTPSTFTDDEKFYQVDYDSGLTGSVKTGKVVDWYVKDEATGTTGELYLNDVRGQFTTTSGFSGDATHTIDSVTLPDVKIGSGEVLYIQNIKPVTRSIEQDEEIKILIGF